MTREVRLAVLGMVFLLPAAILVSTGVLDIQVPSLLVHPVLVMGGLFVALALNALAVFRLRFAPEDGALVGTLRLRGTAMNLSALVLAGLLLASIAAYLFFENYQPRVLE